MQVEPRGQRSAAALTFLVPAAVPAVTLPRTTGYPMGHGEADAAAAPRALAAALAHAVSGFRTGDGTHLPGRRPAVAGRPV